MQLNGGWLVEARRVPSPHYDSRPDNETPSLLVVHNISLPPGEFGGPWIDALFSGTLDPNAHPFFAEIAQLRVSAHCLIRRDGEIVQYVPFDKRAWHAGVSSYRGRERCNDFSIGIELEGTDTLAYTDAQYQQLVAVTRQLILLYPAIADHITGHCDIAPVRKTDPGPAFDWVKFRSLLTPSSE
ncbi:TPA: 1,6-anhydro-N-acetylmuramyl-L-alanine amidase AmpD [Klebsiella oxytoca]|uniref:1,6-anhydro-N-acetylmuramyl-L-alanine amidase AmpD n=1 Tax=Klebsiella oxytoca TaxID=571 RepID=UPI001BD47E7A|nr:1,6-anhydro-N-acetylmuramyl-L-alanine amidase AmpD [Klebsiella oxytoca]MDM4274444.1 1,6-anhydro-N-acetylmuramyl-L-alanine amidase AmpD [Klebsiella oxytoca]MDU7175657.1 1,6-anhydro-N-acetylmuramyl-L-alanine amidase AmpD [Klebsiella oxytoca]HEF4888629.1 1,6-anhydro-N-acetylmuramyl-L-alanine amidase AmpD [Klebsiella oxytoca]